MASGAKRAKVVLYTAEEAVRLFEEDMEEDSSNEGMSSGEESEIDRQLLHFSDESRWVTEIFDRVVASTSH